MIKQEDLKIKNYFTLSEKTRIELFENEINAIDEYFQVSDIYRDGCIVFNNGDEYIDIDTSEILPIELTEQWLIDFGFKKMPDYMHKGNGQDWQPEYPRTYNYDFYNGEFVLRFQEWHWKNSNKIEVQKSTQLFRVYDSYYSNIMEGEVYIDNLNFVHQFQNIIKSLSGLELTKK